MLYCYTLYVSGALEYKGCGNRECQVYILSLMTLNPSITSQVSGFITTDMIEILLQDISSQRDSAWQLGGWKKQC